MMKHLDEGAIHAWLDGGLNPAQAAEVETHVQSCAECSAKVAEARGLIAASSRILMALDDVPANVTPKRVAPVRRRRSITPWVSGLAAAVVLVTVWRAGGVEQSMPAPEIRIPDIATPVVQPPVLSEIAKAPAPAPAPTPQRVDAPRSVAGRAAAAGAGGEELGKLRDAPSKDFGAVAANPAITIVTRDSTAVAAAAALDARREVADEARRSLRPMPSEVAGVEANKADASLRLAGCYRMPAQKSVTEAVTTAVGAAASVARTRAAAGAAAPSAQMAPREAPLALIRLDTAATPDGFALRDPNTGSVRGVWSPINNDSARVMLPAEGTFTFAAREKVPCPER